MQLPTSPSAGSSKKGGWPLIVHLEHTHWTPKVPGCFRFGIVRKCFPIVLHSQRACALKPSIYGQEKSSDAAAATNLQVASVSLCVGVFVDAQMHACMHACTEG